MTSQAEAETRMLKAIGDRYSTVSLTQGHRRGWREGRTALLTELAGWDDLTEAEAVQELRKGDQSIYWPLFKHDPRVWVDCPNDGRTVVGVEGMCDSCGYEVT